ncbi:MAG TPA: metallophosphoesterase [Stackebrandtia sp.]|uniref:metallophosphoesterase family protein n=1 Tax=Stackebrandtia sp. TaxID=2023065 RepID=UPI002D51F12B|nr:metallophosphoesterase [Stackebrandtia sp.]HZE41988.1 metallophosphoesterase [Stackebrandtia sp.]
MRRHPSLRRAAKGTVFGLLALVCAGVGMYLTGAVDKDVGPFRTTIAVEPSTRGESELELPPLGSLIFDSHTAPLRLSLRLDSLDPHRVQHLIADPKGIRHASQSVPKDMLNGVTDVALSALAGATLVGLAAGALIFRSTRRTAICGALSAVVAIATMGLAAGTIKPDSVAEPRYEGILANAPTILGNAQAVADKYEKYRSQLQAIIVNMSRFYALGKNLPSYEPDPDTIRVLHVSDLHLNPASWDVIGSAVKQFHITAVVDTGDLTDWGHQGDAADYAKGIAKLKVPYVFVRGNHDNKAVAREVAKQPNAIVLDNQVKKVAGLSIAGIGDPRHTSDKSAAPSDAREEQVVLDSGTRLRDTIAKHHGADVAMVHDPLSAGPLAKSTPLVLAGHKHQRFVTKMDSNTLEMVQGSTGGAGVQGPDADESQPLSLSVLYFDNHSKKLQAFDDIAVGGTGETEVTLQRHVLKDGMPNDNSDLVPNPDDVTDPDSVQSDEPDDN